MLLLLATELLLVDILAQVKQLKVCLYCSQCEDRHATENDPQGSVDERAMVTNCRVFLGNYVSKMKRLEAESNKHFDG